MEPKVLRLLFWFSSRTVLQGTYDDSKGATD